MLRQYFIFLPPCSQPSTGYWSRRTLESPDEITLGRELRQNGRSVAINGRTVSLGLLREVSSCLVDIHGQSEHLSLLDVRQHLGLLDRFAQADSLHASYLHIYREWQQLRHELAELRSAERDADRRVDTCTPFS